MNPEENNEMLIRIDERTKNILDKLEGIDKRVTKIEDSDKLWKGVSGVAIIIGTFLGIKF